MLKKHYLYTIKAGATYVQKNTNNTIKHNYGNSYVSIYVLYYSTYNRNSNTLINKKNNLKNLTYNKLCANIYLASKQIIKLCIEQKKD